MAEQSKIEWTDHTFNPWEGCTKISPACDFCYAAERAARFKTVEWGGPRRRTSESNWKKPLKWEREANKFGAEFGRRQRVFCASLADVFDNQVPEEWRADLWDLIRKTPSLDWLLLTKRPQNIEKMLPPFWDEIKGRVWLGTTVENQEVAERNIPYLVQHDCAVRFLSCEPMLGAIDLSCIPFSGPLSPSDSAEGFHALRHVELGLDWIIAGGESGPNARSSIPRHLRSLRDQCFRAGIPFLFKQWGEWAPASVVGNVGEIVPIDDRRGSRVGSDDMVKIGKKRAGRKLDGVICNEFPKQQETDHVRT